MLQVIRTFCLAHHTRSTKNKCEKTGEYGSRGDDERLHRMSKRYRVDGGKNRGRRAAGWEKHRRPTGCGQEVRRVILRNQGGSDSTQHSSSG